jgi:hypothetical protein
VSHSVCTIILLATLFVSAGFATTRHYYIAAEDITWDYAPSGRDLLTGNILPQPWVGHTQWHKTRYVEYTDSTFTAQKPQPEWLGILGPVIRAEVGDEIVVEFWNRSSAPHSIHPHGLRYDKKNEGAFYLPFGGGARIPNNAHFTYHWFADEGSGPGPGQLSSVVWWYHPHVDEPRETNAGLMGPIIVTRKGMARPDGSPKDVDREFVASFMIFDELNGKNEGQFHAINGYIFGNLLGLVMKQGEKVRWYLMGMGNEKDLHTPHWHAKTVTDGSRHLDVVELLPASTTAVDMIADNPGTWLFHCQVADHMEAGMHTTFTIYQPSTRPCPIELTAGTFWSGVPTYTVTLKNLSKKPIQSFMLRYDHLMAPGYLLAPFNNLWRSSQPLQPGAEQTLSMPTYGRKGQDILAWAVSPAGITYMDGTKWVPQQSNECFTAFWRDKDHPEMTVLPPEQVQTQED